MCDCSEERERRERQRRREEAARARAEDAAFEPDEDPSEAEGYSPLKIACGTLGFLLALIALLLKTVDNDTLHDILEVFGLGYLVPKKKKPCLNPNRLKWPPVPPPAPCPPPKQPKKRC